MSESPNINDAFDLSLLARRLVLEGMPIQSIIASEAGVSQSTVSRAIHGRIRTDSDGARKLWAYASGRAELLSGGPPSNEVRTPKVRTTRRSALKSRRRTDAAVAPHPADRQKLAQEALNGLQDYLNDAFDPQLVIEQLAVLRRAQDPSRIHGSRA